MLILKRILLITYLFAAQTSALPDLSGCLLPPDKCPNSNITFWLYTRSTRQNPHQLDVAVPESLNSSYFIADVPIKILIHGYTGDKDYSPNSELRPAYFKRGEYNVISVDWHPLALEPCYPTAANNVQLVGKCLAQLIDELVSTQNLSLRLFHVIGFSLGAQVSGAISNYLKSGLLDRITGLDPAMPLFVTPDINGKLDKGDAKFVDVIHTNALEKGKLESSGDVDFYVNGGMKQPGCNKEQNMSESGCSHWRAPVYYGESINCDLCFYGKKCYSWFLYMLNWCQFNNNTEEVIMGEFTPNTAQGLFFLDTNSEEPFGRGRSGNGSQSSQDPTDTHDVESAPSSIPSEAEFELKDTNKFIE